MRSQILITVSKKTETVRRFDRASLTRVIRTDEGYLRAPARLTRAGVFEYRNAGKVWRELRLPEEVFQADSLKSFELLPLVDQHPRENNGAIDSTNVKRLQVGSVGRVTRDESDPNYVSGEILITDAAIVSKVEGGSRELSCGYYCEREPAAPGSVYKDPVTDAITPYDFVQRNIRGNHVAIVDQGRAGPDARIMLDHNDGIEHSPDGDPVDPKGAPMLKKITVDGVSFEVAENIAQAFEKFEREQKTAIDKLTARADSADSQVKELTGKLALASDSKRFEAAVSARVALVKAADAYEVKCDGLDDAAIKRAVIAKIDPSIKLDGKSADYVDAAFDLACTRNPVSVQLDSVNPGTSQTSRPAAPGSEGKHRQEYVTGFFGHDATKRSDK